MKIKLEYFLHDLVWLIKEDYNNGLDATLDAKTEIEKAFGEGQTLAYYHVLDLIEKQLFVFGASTDLYNGITPNPGEKAEFKKSNF